MTKQDSIELPAAALDDADGHGRTVISLDGHEVMVADPGSVLQRLQDPLASVEAWEASDVSPSAQVAKGQITELI
jgi:hypothetical protein